jgi:hypothetical protein
MCKWIWVQHWGELSKGLRRACESLEIVVVRKDEIFGQCMFLGLNDEGLAGGRK